MKRGSSHGRSGGSTFQDKEAMSMQACRWKEYLTKSKEANMVRKTRVCCEVKELTRGLIL